MPSRTRTTPRRTSISDVAKTAGVSVGTVSNVLNRPERVLPGTRDRVQQAIEQLSFVPNGSARQLRAGTITTIGALVLDIANPFFTEVVRGLEDRLAQDDYTLMLASSDEDPAREARYLRLFEEHGVYGVLVVPTAKNLERLEQMHRRGIHVVLLDRQSPLSGISSAAVDDVMGGRLAIQHLLELGHTSIAMINGTHTLHQCAERWAGARQAVVEAGLDPTRTLREIKAPSLNSAGGERAALTALARRRNPATALFCVNDLTALGAMRALREGGVSVPGDMAVVGYDDIGFAAELAIPLTSVRQPTHALGYRAADLLLTRDSGSEQVMFSPELVVRQSSGAVA